MCSLFFSRQRRHSGSLSGVDAASVGRHDIDSRVFPSGEAKAFGYIVHSDENLGDLDTSWGQALAGFAPPGPVPSAANDGAVVPMALGTVWC